MLTDEDWVEIYYALVGRLDEVRRSGDRKWIRHLKQIIERIGPDGENMYRRNRRG